MSPWREVRCAVPPGGNLLAAAMACGAVEDTSCFCLEGRCDSCMMEAWAYSRPLTGST